MYTTKNFLFDLHRRSIMECDWVNAMVVWKLLVTGTCRVTPFHSFTLYCEVPTLFGVDCIEFKHNIKMLKYGRIKGVTNNQ
jgi:hypothetical protein